MTREPPDYRPSYRPRLRGGHLHTLLGYWVRRGLSWTAPEEDWIVEVEPDVRLLLRASWHDGEARPALVIVHGLQGSDRSGYALATGLHAWSRGWHVVRMNLRGSGDSEQLCPRLYNAGLDGDLLGVLRKVAERAPRLAVIGFSLGGNLTLLCLSRRVEALPAGLIGGVAVSPPLDLAACADALARPGNWLYARHFMVELRESYRRRQRLRPDLYEAGREVGPRTIREYDHAITAPYGGYAGADDYYARSSSGPLLRELTRPALILAAADDPMIPRETVERWPLSPTARRELLETGGHVGFVADTRAPGSLWAAERALDYLEGLESSVRG
jgi:predicted alpha/beta-fold hydrolase